MSNTIVLYDIPSTVPGSAWSPNVWKTRYTLNYKGLAYRTEWVEYPDIESTCKQIGAPPTTTRDGRPLYTLPVIYDPSTGAAVAESTQIAEYLDATYPDTPTLLPEGTKTVQYAFLAGYRSILPNTLQFAYPATERILNPRSEAYFNRFKYGPTIPHESPTGEAREVEWKKVETDFGLLAGWMDKGETDGPYILGAKISFLDFSVAAFLLWFKTIFGEQSDEWQRIKAWHGGKWGIFLERFKEYENVVV
ncbi:hypothetical protein H0H87_000196 [Tephrocybe sp. NHM501043]|nr:hypothetical protein H0H87_000196 [Tephrocybe sp. NHM501043]